MTEYQVLSLRSGLWSEEQKVEAHSTKAAIAAFVKDESDSADGVFVAVPVRSWKPVKVTLETQTRLTFS